MAEGQKKQLALDTNFLLNLAGQAGFSQELQEVFQAKGYAFRVPPTVMVELRLLSGNAVEPHKRELAEVALSKLREWDLAPYALPSAQRIIPRRFAAGLITRGLIPEDEGNDGLILAETALEAIPLLITSDKHLLDIEDSDLALAFNQADLPVVTPVHPKRLLRAMK